MRRRHVSASFIVAAAMSVAACGSSGESSGRSSGGSTGGSTGGSSEPDAQAASVERDTTPTGGEPGPICDSIPSLDTLTSILREPVTMATDNSSPTVELGGDTVITQRCDVSSDGIASIVFERVDLTTGAAILAGIAAEDLAVNRSFPDLPGATAWANGVIIEHDSLFWSAVAITTTTAGQLDAPQAYDDSAAVLSAWINE